MDSKKIQRFEVHAPWQWRVCFFFISALPLLMGLIPWFGLLTSEHSKNPWSILVAVVVFSFPLCFGLMLLFYSLRKGIFSIESGQLIYTFRLLGLSRSRALKFDKIKLKLASFGHRNPQLWLVIYGYHNESERMLVNEQSCDSVEQLFDWLNHHSNIECVDASNEQFTG